MRLQSDVSKVVPGSSVVMFINIYIYIYIYIIIIIIIISIVDIMISMIITGGMFLRRIPPERRILDPQPAE